MKPNKFLPRQTKDKETLYQENLRLKELKNALVADAENFQAQLRRCQKEKQNLVDRLERDLLGVASRPEKTLFLATLQLRNQLKHAQTQTAALQAAGKASSRRLPAEELQKRLEARTHALQALRGRFAAAGRPAAVWPGRGPTAKDLRAVVAEVNELAAEVARREQQGRELVVEVEGLERRLGGLEEGERREREQAGVLEGRTKYLRARLAQLRARITGEPGRSERSGRSGRPQSAMQTGTGQKKGRLVSGKERQTDGKERQAAGQDEKSVKNEESSKSIKSIKSVKSVKSVKSSKSIKSSKSRKHKQNTRDQEKLSSSFNSDQRSSSPGANKHNPSNNKNSPKAKEKDNSKKPSPSPNNADQQVGEELKARLQAAGISHADALELLLASGPDAAALQKALAKPPFGLSAKAGRAAAARLAATDAAEVARRFSQLTPSFAPWPEARLRTLFAWAAELVTKGEEPLRRQFAAVGKEVGKAQFLQGLQEVCKAAGLPAAGRDEEDFLVASLIVHSKSLAALEVDWLFSLFGTG